MERQKEAQKKISMTDVFLYGFKFTARYCPVLLLLMAGFGLINGVTMGLTILTMQHLFDSVERMVTGAATLQYALGALAVLAVVLVADRVVSAVHWFMYAVISDKTGGGMQLGIHKKMAHLHPIHLENTAFHDDISKADRGKWPTLGVTWTIVSLLTFYVPYFVFMAFYLNNLNNMFIFAIVLVFVPTMLGQIIRTKIVSKFTDLTAPIQREHGYYHNALTHPRYFKETRLLGGYSFFMRKFMTAMESLSKAELRANRQVNLLDGVIALLSAGGYMGILWMLFSALMSGEISVGAFAAVFGAVGVMFHMMEGIIQHRLGDAARGLGEAHNFIRFMSMSERGGADATPDLIQGIVAENLSFTYPGSTKKNLDNINLRIEPGETVAIVGANGAGKSTLVRLLIGLYTPDEGSVTLHGMDTQTTNMASLFSGVSGVFQKYQRYALTLRENVKMGDITANTPVEDALDEAGVPHQDTATYPKGLDTMLSREFDGENGVDLSGGQWQRVSIARGLYRTHEIIVLDEPTAAIDPVEESRIYEKFVDIAKEKTALIVTHRLGSTKIADRVIVVDAGQIVATGTHEELLTQGGVYAEMFHAQADWYDQA